MGRSREVVGRACDSLDHGHWTAAEFLPRQVETNSKEGAPDGIHQMARRDITSAAAVSNDNLALVRSDRLHHDLRFVPAIISCTFRDCEQHSLSAVQQLRTVKRL